MWRRFSPLVTGSQRRHLARRAGSQRRATPPSKPAKSIVEVWTTADVKSLPAANLHAMTLAALPTLSPQELTTLVRAVARSDLGTASPWNSLWTGLSTAAAPLLPAMTGLQLATLAHSFASVGKRAPRLFDELSEHATATPQLLDNCHPRSLVALAWAYAFIGHEAPSLLRAVGASAARRLSEFEPRHLSLIHI